MQCSLCSPTWWELVLAPNFIAMKSKSSSGKWEILAGTQSVFLWNVIFPLAFCITFSHFNVSLWLPHWKSRAQELSAEQMQPMMLSYQAIATFIVLYVYKQSYSDSVCGRLSYILRGWKCQAEVGKKHLITLFSTKKAATIRITQPPENPAEGAGGCLLHWATQVQL